jgi:hypothetical protein
MISKIHDIHFTEPKGNMILENQPDFLKMYLLIAPQGPGRVA